LSDPAVTEALGRTVDFFWIDLEHSPLGLELMQAHLIAARAVGVPALVRVPAAEAWFIKRVIDTGASGLIVPQVRSPDEVRSVVQACRYQPQGDRGYGPRRASNYGHDVGYLETINRDLFVSVQIEHVEAVRALDEIAAVPAWTRLFSARLTSRSRWGWRDRSRPGCSRRHQSGDRRGKGARIVCRYGGRPRRTMRCARRPWVCNGSSAGAISII
jgi:hypothetical protein